MPPHPPRRQRLDRAPGMPADPREVAAARLQVLAEACTDRRLGDLDVRALTLLAAARLDIVTGLASRSGELLAGDLNIAARSSFRVLARLQAAGYLLGYRTPGRSTVYSIDWKRFSDPPMTSESWAVGARHRIGRRAPWAARLREEPLPFPGLAPAGMDREQVVVCATYAVAHDLEFKRVIARTIGGRGTGICRLGRDILRARAVGGTLPDRRWGYVTVDDVDQLRGLLVRHPASVFADCAEEAP